MNLKILLLLQKRTRTTFRSNFVNRPLKLPIITKKPDIRLKEPPFMYGTFLREVNVPEIPKRYQLQAIRYASRNPVGSHGDFSEIHLTLSKILV